LTIVDATMETILNQVFQFLQQGVSAIFHFVEVVWSWSVGQITKLMAAPWPNWPLWKQICLVLVCVVVIVVLYKAAMELWRAAERILAAFAAFIVVLVKTLPSVLLAGVIALGGVWIINHLDDSLVHLPTAFQLNSQ
jgi:hypothetical protein